MLRPYIATLIGGLTLVAGPALAQNQPVAPANRPDGIVGSGELLNIQVLDVPEFSRSYRVTSGGELRMPMLKDMIRVEGLRPADVATLIANTLKREQLVVDPSVRVSVVSDTLAPTR